MFRVWTNASKFRRIDDTHTRWFWTFFEGKFSEIVSHNYTDVFLLFSIEWLHLKYVRILSNGNYSCNFNSICKCIDKPMRNVHMNRLFNFLNCTTSTSSLGIIFPLFSSKYLEISGLKWDSKTSSSFVPQTSVVST